MDRVTRKKELVIRSFVALVYIFSLCTIAPVHAEDVLIEGRVPGCGDGVVESLETCDATNLNGQSCTTLGFSGGVLACTDTCTLDTSACTVTTRGGGGGGGGSSSQTNSSRSLVALSGSTIPLAKIALLVDGSIVASTTADQIGRFSFAARNLSPGTYQFSMYARDAEEVQTSAFTFHAALKSRSVIKYENVVLSPTVTSEFTAITQDNTLTIHGATLPNVVTTATIMGPNKIPRVLTATSSSDGRYSFSFDTGELELGYHTITTRSTLLGSSTPKSRPLPILVGDTTILKKAGSGACPVKADLNQDCKVNLVDFSIMVFWFNKPVSSDAIRLEKEMLSGDGKFSFTDFGILLYWWTG